MQRNRNVHYGNSCYDCKKSLFIQTQTTTPALSQRWLFGLVFAGSFLQLPYGTLV